MDAISYRVSLLTGTTTANPSPGQGGTAGVEVLDEGVSLGQVQKINFVGADVAVQAGGGTATVYVPPVALASAFNSQGGTTDARVGAVPTATRLLGRGGRTGTVWTVPLLQTGGNLGSQVLRATTTAANWTLQPAGAFAVPAAASQLVLTVLDENDAPLAGPLTLPLGAGNTAQMGPISQAITSYQPQAYQFTATASATLAAGLFTGASGRFTVRWRHELTAGNTLLGEFTQTLYFDRNQPAVALSGAVTFSVKTPVLKYLSGVPAYTLGTTFNAAATGADYTTTNTWPADGVLLEMNGDVLGLQQLEITGPGLAGWSNVVGTAGASFGTQTWAVTVAGLAYRGAAQVRGRVLDYGPQPWLPSAARQVVLDTLADSATRVVEKFTSETRRLTAGLGAWNSQTLLAGTANLQVVAGGLRRVLAVNYGTYEPAGPNYTAGGAAGPQYYYRQYATAGPDKSNGVFILTGVSEAQLASQAVTVEISLDGQAWYSLNAAYNPAAGALQNGSGCRVEPGSFALGSNGRIKFTLGTSFGHQVYLRLGVTDDTIIITECSLETWA